MSGRALDYYTKGLSIETRQKLFDYLRHRINAVMMKEFLEKDIGYWSFHACGFSDDDIKAICDSYVPKFEYVNQVMAANNRPPLFSDPHDSFKSAQEHKELMEWRSDEELTSLFGCSYEDYVPAVLS